VFVGFLFADVPADSQPENKRRDAGYEKKVRRDDPPVPNVQQVFLLRWTGDLQCAVGPEKKLVSDRLAEL